MAGKKEESQGKGLVYSTRGNSTVKIGGKFVTLKQGDVLPEADVEKLKPHFQAKFISAAEFATLKDEKKL